LSIYAITAVAVAAFGVPASAADRFAIAGSHATWATVPNKVGPLAPTENITFRVYLKMADVAGAEATARAISTPGSPAYHHFLTPEQVRKEFGPSGSAVGSVRAWLRSTGFKVGATAVNNMYVEAIGSVAKVQQAFAVDLNRYRVRDSVVRAADRELTVPASVAPVIASVIGVDNALSLARPNTAGGDETSHRRPGKSSPSTAPPPDGFRNAPPCSSYWTQKVDSTDPAYGDSFAGALPYAPCGYKPEQLRDAYGLSDLNDDGMDGRGTTVAVVDAFVSPTLYKDVAEYSKRNDKSNPLKKSQFSELVFPASTELEPADACNASGWYGEQTLDVEAVHAMAPGAHILYVAGSDCKDLSLDKALNEIVSRNLAQIVSNSYGVLGEEIPVSEVITFEAIAVQAALEGIGLYFSSGDNGDESASLGKPSADFSASSPWVTAVGGTSLGIDKHGRRVVETGWETGRSILGNGAWTPAAPGQFLYGSGGGTSRLFAEPWYQRGVVPSAMARQNQTAGGFGRVVPDISMVGDPNTGFLIGQTQTFPDGVYYSQYRIGGTSLSSPLLAGFVAVADQVAGHRHGFINPALYGAAAHTGAIRDVQHIASGVVRVDYTNALDEAEGVAVSVRSFDFAGLTIHTGVGYDNVTGIGTPAGASLLFLL
jgi:subtilase family serine protease